MCVYIHIYRYIWPLVRTVTGWGPVPKPQPSALPIGVGRVLFVVAEEAGSAECVGRGFGRKPTLEAK